MNRSEFDNLELLEQINYINNQLKGGYTLTKLCTSIGIGRTTVRGRFIKEGYVFNTEVKQYYRDDTLAIQTSQGTIEHSLIPINKGNLKELQKNAYDLKDLIAYKNGTEELLNNKNDLLELINNKNDLMEMLKNYKNNAKIIDIPQLDINTIPQELQSKIINKSIKVYDLIYKKFDEVCSQYGSIKKQDLISLALLEFYNKYKK